MATSKLFKKVPLTAPNRSGFNMSHNNFFSAPVGTLVPNLIDFLIPGDEIDLSSKSHVQLPPMATDFYGRIEYKEEAFFVPCRILFGGWKDFFVNPVDGTTNPSNIDGQLAKYLIGAIITDSLPYNQSLIAPYSKVYPLASSGALLDVYDTFIKDFSDVERDDSLLESSSSSSLGAGSLLDYLGFKVSASSILVPESLKVQPFNYLSVFIDKPYDYIRENSETIYTNLVSNSQWNTIYTEDVTLIQDDFSVVVTYSLQMFIRNSGYVDIRVTELVKSFNYNGVQVSQNPIQISNILPIMAYHKVFDDWYRSPQIQQSLFKRNIANSSTATSVANMPWITSGADDKVYFTGNQLNFANGHNLFDLHQRNWQKDFFTSMTPEPQAGEASSVKFDIVDNSGEFTIASLRAANALQQWLDRNNIGGFRYGDMIYAQYGVYPSDAITDRAIYLGSSSTEVYNKSIYQQSGDGGQNTNNPFNAIGSKYSNPIGVGQGSFCNNYRVTEAGFVIKIGSLVPQAYYSTGVRRMFHYNDISDIAFPVLAGVGDQEVLARELIDIYSGEGDTNVLGYQQRYAEYKFIDDQVHGLLRDGQSLASFALQRSFSQAPQLGSEFLQIPRDYLDQVSATDYKLSEYGCWVNCYNDYRKSSTLPAYSIPTLEDMKGHTILVDKGGNYIA